MAPTIPLPRYDYLEMMGESGINQFSDLINQPPAVKVKRSTTGPSIPTGTGYTNISWEAETYDPFNMWVIGNPSAVTIVYTAQYDLLLQTKWPQMAATTTRARIVKMPGSLVIGDASSFGANVAAGTTFQLNVPQYPLTAGDYLICQAQQDDVSARSLSVVDSGTFFSVKYYCSGVLGT